MNFEYDNNKKLIEIEFASKIHANSLVTCEFFDKFNDDDV